MFERTRITLTAWYLLIIISISLLFSFVIYTGVENEFRRFERFKIVIQEDTFGRPIKAIPIPSSRLDPEMIQEARARLLTTLGIINLCILILSGGAGYFLAGRTLKPIQEMVDEQKRFLTDASHELRTPLTSLRTEIEVGLRNKHLSLKEARELLKSNLEEVENLQALSNNLLTLTHSEQLTQLPKTSLDLSLPIEQAIKKVETLLREKQMKVEKKLLPLSVEGVEDRLTELFVILLDNASKYGSAKTTIEIVMKKRGKEATVAITNKGEGISKEDLPHLFERFYRGSKSRSKQEVGGYGLGLSIAKQIVITHNGEISVKSDTEKTTFTVKLPLIS